MSNSLTTKQEELIEKIGVFHEQRGMQPLMGRILGLLMVLEDAEATFDEIVEKLQVSKSAVSNALNFMQVKNFIAYRTKIGDRKRYFYLRMGENWETDLTHEIMELTKINDFFKEVLELRSNKHPEFNKNLTCISEFLEFFKEQVPVLLEKFKNKKN
ncbi:GbsR/MarR family transcriptional regulator [Lunatibacter salilacus]|uniref:GbsR/MarR family transcriptional regulator n=1 Tax=Lunatibacter salilacus TaxID=2483804 RepID=UPI001F17A65B|nr:MarR family transcriptional regulator [Lunatibacter salilacus]